MPSPRLSSHWPRLPELDGEAKLLAKHIDTLTTTAAPENRERWPNLIACRERAYRG